ncbi:MAG: ABC transporter ATP-binding protein [Thermoanaerobaculum sp.]
MSADTHPAPAGGEPSPLLWLLRWAYPYRLRMVAATVLVTVGALLQVVGPLLTAAAVDLYLRPEPSATGRRVTAVLAWLTLPQQGFGGLVSLALLYFLALALGSALMVVQARTMLTTGQLVMRDLREKLFAHLQTLDLAYFHRTPAGRIITRLTSDVDAVNELFTSGFVEILADSLLLVGIVVMLFSLSARLAVVAFAVLPLLVLLAAWFRRRARAVYLEVRTKFAAVNTHLQEHLAGISVVQLLRAQGASLERLVGLDAEHRNANIRGIFYYAVFYPTVELLTAFGIAGIMYFGAGWSQKGLVSLGVLVAFLQYVQRFYRPIGDLAENYNVLQASIAASVRLRELLAIQPELADPPQPLTPSPAGTLEFRGVTFAYDPDDPPALRNVSFALEAGERVAVVGHTGAGKSTLVNLLLRFYDPQEGAVLVDGVDVRRWRRAELRARFAVVLQDVDCFAGTIRENVSLGRPGISDDRILWALEQVQAGKLVERLPRGLDTVLGERGAGLSVGERQLVAFARALVGDPEFVILDEATASVDPLTEARIQKALQRLLAGRTALVIAHRLATTQMCQRVLVFHRGKLVEEGTHGDLLARRGTYFALFTRAQLAS